MDCSNELALVLIEPDAERVDLALELGQALGQPVTLLAEGFGQRDHRVDEPTLAILGSRDDVHLATSADGLAASDSKPDAARATSGAHLARDVVSPPDSVTSEPLGRCRDSVARRPSDAC